MAAEITTLQKYINAVGRRKSASARVIIKAGKGEFTINKKSQSLTANLSQLLKLVGELNKWDISAFTTGGGISSQESAISLGIARCLIKANPELRMTLKKGGFLTRDGRKKERKKPGLKGARRAPQWSKR